ncbi:MAG: tyrosine-type recombinase/integrase [Chloroflexota bacterium]|nr:tyrosine-type recombinase/integrase [Chloroflexota bacterium]
MRLRLPPRKLAPGNRKAPRRDSSVVDRPSFYRRARLQSILNHFETYLDQHALSPATVRNYLADLRAFSRWHAARRRTTTFSPDDFRAYRDHLCRETQHSPATVNRRLQSLRLFGRFLHEMGHAPENPTRELQLLRNGNGHSPAPRTLSPTEAARLNEAIRAGRPRLVQRDYAILQLMLHAGLRVHEVAALRLSDLGAARRGMTVAVRGNPGGKDRLVPLDSAAARAVREYLPTRPAIPRVDHLFLSQRGCPLSVRSIQRLVDSYARSAGLKGISAQSLRHTCAKKMLEETRDPALVAQRLGHQNARALGKYLR